MQVRTMLRESLTIEWCGWPGEQFITVTLSRWHGIIHFVQSCEDIHIVTEYGLKTER